MILKIIVYIFLSLIFVSVPNVESNFDLLILKDGYEEASGISTPSKEILSVENSQSFITVSNSYVKVVKNKILSVVRIHKFFIVRNGSPTYFGSALCNS